MSEQEQPQFRTGQVWLSPKQTWYRVEETQNGQATLRLGLEGNGRRVRRKVTATKGWEFVAPLVTPALIQDALAGKFS